MRILAATPYYEPEGGGLERYAHAILSRLAAAGHDVHAMAFTREAPKRERRQGVHVTRHRPRWRVGNTPVDGDYARAMRRAVRDLRPDVVVAHTPVPFPAYAAWRAARAEGVPFVLTYHAGRLRGSSPVLDAAATVLRGTVERSMLRTCDGLIAVGPYVRDHALASQRHRTEIVPPGVDADLYAPEGAPTPDSLLFVGPLDSAYRWKGVDVLVEAFREVRSARPGARLTLLGNGDRHEAFRRRAENEPGLTVSPRLPERALVRAYRDAAVTVLPSVTDAESFGMVLAEANACGRPVIGSRIGGIPGFVDHGRNGYLARPGDPMDLADRILDLLDDPARARRMGTTGRRRVLAEHDWGTLARRTEAALARA